MHAEYFDGEIWHNGIIARVKKRKQVCRFKFKRNREHIEDVSFDKIRPSFEHKLRLRPRSKGYDLRQNPNTSDFDATSTSAVSSKELVDSRDRQCSDIRKQALPWLEAEDRLILESRIVFGLRWNDVYKKLPGRSCANVRIRFHSYMKPKIEKYLAEKQKCNKNEIRLLDNGRYDLMGDFEGVFAATRKESSICGRTQRSVLKSSRKKQNNESQPCQPSDCKYPGELLRTFALSNLDSESGSNDGSDGDVAPEKDAANDKDEAAERQNKTEKHDTKDPLKSDDNQTGAQIGEADNNGQLPTYNKWTPEEDTMLRSAVKAHGAKNWKQISTLLPLRSDKQCLNRWHNDLKPGLIKGSWTKAEDDTVCSLVEQYGIKRWSFIAKHLPGRSRIQCRERWYYHLSPDIKKTEWTEEEDIVIVDLHQKLGNRWALMAKELPGRTNNAIYNRWNYTLKRVLRQGNGSLAEFHKISGIKRKLAVAQQVAASVTVPPAPSGPTAPAQRPPAPGYHGDTSPTASCERYDGHVSPAASNRRSAPSAPGPLYNYRNGERRALVMSCQSESIPNGTNSVSPNSGRKKSKKRHFDCEGF